MDAREFLKEIVENMPSRGLDNVDIYIEEETEEDPICYKIEKITNYGNNDSLFIVIKKA